VVTGRDLKPAAAGSESISMDTTGARDHTPEHGSHYAGSIIGVLLAYLRREYGDETVARVLELAGEDRPLEVLEDVDIWSSHAQVTRLYHVAAEVTGDDDIGRRAGEELIRQYRGTAVETLLRELGSPGAVLENVTQTAAKFSTVLEMEALEVGPTHAVVTATGVDGFARTRVMCGYTKGVLSQASALFGMDLAEVDERQCQAAGDARCEYVVRWDPSTIEHNLQRRIEHLESELASITTRFNALQETATELVGARDVEELLSCITKQAADTVRAPRHVLAVRTVERGPLHVHAFGFENEDTAPTIDEIMAETPSDEGGSRLIVDIASRTRYYGRLAAIYPRGASFLPAEHRLLAAYAGHAAAALEAAAARQEAERRNATARALLELASSLAQVGTQADVATRLAEAVPHVVDCDACGVFLCDGDETLHLYGASGYAAQVEELLRSTPISTADEPALGAMIRSPQPAFLDPSRAGEPLQKLLDVTGSASVVVMPIRYRDEFFGVVTASVRDDARRLDHDEHLLERLQGMASHAATALLNARLLEQISHQATHDGLTGLPNRLLLKDRAEQAAARAREHGTTTALLYVDLDGFKGVNDSFGHAAGDELLTEVAARLASVIRPSDVVARLGGDEFAVLLADVTGGAIVDGVTKRIRAEIERPYRINGRELVISASIGRSIMEPGDDYESLLRRGDTAMYEAKRARRARPAVPYTSPAGA
jgi:diguanylate cyclase (GGDEF)-like protein